MKEKEIKEKIIEILQKHDDEDSLREETASQILELFSQQEKEILEELLKELPKEYHWVHGHLPGEVSCKTCWELKGKDEALAEIRNLIEQKLKELT